MGRGCGNNAVVNAADAADVSSPINSAAANSTNNGEAMSRVIIKFKPGKKETVLSKVGLGTSAASSASDSSRSGGRNKNKKKLHYEFSNLNTLAVTVPTSALEGLKTDPNIVRIEEDPIRYLVPTTIHINQMAKKSELGHRQAQAAGSGDSTQTVPYGIDMVEARDIWDSNRDGVIDTTMLGGDVPTGANRKV